MAIPTLELLLPRVCRWALAATLALLAVAAASPAAAQSAYCDDLKAQIARAGSSAGAGNRAAMAKQQRELQRAGAYAHQVGCDRQQFLFFGDAPPPQCGALNARIARMQANLSSLDAANSGNESQRQGLIARFDAQCRNHDVARASTARPRNFFEELFGVAPPADSGALREVPIEDTPLPGDGSDPLAQEDERPSGGSMAVCVRSCDGGFFPVSYSARRSSLDDLASLCKALCPNTEVSLYTKAFGRDIDSAVSIDGASYSDHPNALKFQKSYDKTCTCKPPDKNWSEALVDAEQILAQTHSKDQVLTEEQADKLSRPVAADMRAKPRLKNLSTPDYSPAPPNPVPAPPPEASAQKTPAQGVFRDVVGPDGVKRRVRAVAPTL